MTLVDWSRQGIAHVCAGLGVGFTLGLLFRNLSRRTVPSLGSPFSTAILDTMDDGGDPEYKLVLVIRNDLKMGKGKACAQCSHASVMAYKEARKSTKLLKKWMAAGQRKVVVKVDSEKELLDVMRTAKQEGLPTVCVQDAGRTQVDPGTRTVVGIGPGPSGLVDKVTGHLKLY